MEPNYIIIGIVVLIVIIGMILVRRRDQHERAKLTKKLNEDYQKDGDLEIDANDETNLH